MDWVTTYPFNVLWDAARDIKGHPRSKGDVNIGHDVWIGAEALIMSGVTIETGAVIGARAVVTHNIPAYCIAAGNPARVVKKRFNDTIISRLLDIEWWGWDDARIEKYLYLMLDDDIEKFLETVEKLKS